MADKGPEHEEGSESLSATGMFLRSFAPSSQESVAPVDPTPVATPAYPAAKPPTEPSEFTRMFQPFVSPESTPAISSSPIATPPPGPRPPDAGEFTRAFIVPSSVSEQPSPTQTAPIKLKGYSTPGISDSASAEGSFTRIFRPDPQPLPRQDTPKFHNQEPETFPAFNLDVSTPSPEAPLILESHRQETSPQNSGFTDLFNALAPGAEKTPKEDAYRSEPVPVPRPYAEPTRLPGPDRPAGGMPPGGGVTALLDMLTQETPRVPSPPVPGALQRSPTLQETPPPPASPAETRGEFTRIIQAGEIQAALAPATSPPPPSTSTVAAPAFPGPSVPPLQIPAIQPALFASAIPHLAVPAAPKLQIPAPAASTPEKSKLQEMVPLLLIANAFLMLILILLVAFALHRR